MPKYLVIYTKHFLLLDIDYTSIELFEDLSQASDYENNEPKGSLKSASVWIYSKVFSKYEKLYDKEWYYN